MACGWALVPAIAVAVATGAGCLGDGDLDPEIAEARRAAAVIGVSHTARGVIGLDGNAPPNAVDDTATVAEDSGATPISVLGNDSDPNGDALSITAVSQPTGGAASVVITGGTGLSFHPAPNFNGVAMFTYTISDGHGGTDTAAVTVTVTPVNDPPTAVDDTAALTEDSVPTAFAVLANDATAPDTGETLSIISVTQPGGGAGTVEIVGGGTGLNFQPAASFNGIAMFTYTISDGHGGTDTATVTVTVTPVNDPPIAVDDTASVAEDAGATPIAVLANDTTAPDTGETLSIAGVTQPDGGEGAVAITGGGTGLTFQPTANFHGTAAFTYTIADGHGGTSTATVTVTVAPVNDPPTAVDDAAAVPVNSGASAIPVLANDTTAPDTGETLTITAVTQPVNGAVSITGGGTGLTFQPATSFAGTTAFTYAISDGNGGTATATVTVLVTSANIPPAAVDDTAAVAEDAAATAIAVLGNDSDPNSDALTITAVTQPTGGTVVITGGGTGLTFQPAPGFVGTAAFVYTISDGHGGTASATATVTVTPINHPPIAVDDTATIAEDAAATTIPVLGNDSTATDTGETLSIASVTLPAGGEGAVAITGGGTGLTFQPAANFHGTAAFTYTTSDGNGGTATATVTVTVTSVNDAPVAVDDTATVAEGSAATPIAVLGNDGDVDGDTPTIIAASQPTGGTVVITGGGTGLTFQPAPGFAGTAAFTYTVSDGAGATATATVMVTVTAASEPPDGIDTNHVPGDGCQASRGAPTGGLLVIVAWLAAALGRRHPRQPAPSERPCVRL